MTDDNKSEGPYKHEHDHSVYTRCLECKSWGINLPSETRCGNCSAEAGVLYVPQCCVRAAYAEGRKAAEKDLEELLEMTEYVVDRIGDSGPFGQMHALEKFRAWEKARGIE